MDDQKATVYLPAKVCCGKRSQHLRGYSVAIYGIFWLQKIVVVKGHNI